MTPETMLGQLLTVLYSLVGLPISMLALKTFGEIVASGVLSVVLRIEKSSFKTTHVDNIRMKTFLGTCLLMILFLLLGAVIEVLAEGWSFVEGIYVWFIVFSTIGFGDYIPFQSLDQKANRKMNQNCLWVLIFVLAFFTLAGLCVVSAVLTSLVQAAEEHRSKTKAGVKLVQFVRRQRKKVTRSEMYTVNCKMGNKAERLKNEDVSLSNYRRVRSKSI